MFESLFEIDPEAAESDLRAMVERLERMKSAAAAAQARATALWAAKRSAAEEAARVRALRLQRLEIPDRALHVPVGVVTLDDDVDRTRRHRDTSDRMP